MRVAHSRCRRRGRRRRAAVAQRVAGHRLGHDSAVVHRVHGVVAAAAVPRVVLHTEDLGVADEAAQRQVALGDGVLDVPDEAEAALALVAARRDLHHGPGAAADYALQRQRERGREISCHIIC